MARSKTLTRRAAIAFSLAATMAATAPAAFAADATYREFVVGNPKAKVTVIEYASLTCPHCAHFQADEYPKLKKEFIDTGKIKFIFRDFPLDGLAMGAALLARCVPGNKGYELIQTMLNNQLEWMRSDQPVNILRGYAEKVGLDSAGFDACLKNEAILTKIQDEQKRALTTYKVPGTPTFVVNETIVPGIEYDMLKDAIETAMK